MLESWKSFDRVGKESVAEKLLRLERTQRLRWIYGTEYHTDTRGRALDFQQRPYLVGLYQDSSPDIVVRKSVQSGISTWAICDALACAERGLNVLYVLPKYQLRNRFVKRIDKSVARSKYYQENIGESKTLGESNSLAQKTFFDSEVVFASSETASDFIEFPADCFIIDELDFCDEENILLAPDRVSASSYKWSRKISTPTHEDYGIDSAFKDSDQKYWNIKCEACGEWQPLDFFENVTRPISENVYELIDDQWEDNPNRDILVYCRECERPLDRLAAGEWVAQKASDISGYHISKLFTASNTVAELWKAYREAQSNPSLLRRFHNSDLGLPYTASGDRLSRAALLSCREDYKMSHRAENNNRYYMGVDVGGLLNVIISDSENRIVLAKSVGDFSDVSRLMESFSVVSCVVDIRPETREARAFQSLHKGKVTLCEYTDSNLTKENPIQVKKDEGVVQVHRTQTIDLMVAEIMNQAIKLPMDLPRDFFEQMTVPVRVLEDTSKGPEARWSKGNDHYFHALNYCRIATKVYKPLLYSF